MIRKLLLPLLSRTRFAPLMIGVGLFGLVSTGAQAQLSTNWSLGFLHGGPDDFDVKDTTRLVLRPIGTIRVSHAYFTQSVTNLDINHLYTISGRMKEGWWRGDQGTGYDPNGDGKRDKFVTYIEAIGGLGTSLPDGRAGLVATNPSPIYPGFPDLIYYGTDNGSITYSVKQKPDATGKIEIRLHYDKIGQVIYDKCWLMHGTFNNISLTP